MEPPPIGSDHSTLPNSDARPPPVRHASLLTRQLRSNQSNVNTDISTQTTTRQNVAEPSASRPQVRFAFSDLDNEMDDEDDEDYYQEYGLEGTMQDPESDRTVQQDPQAAAYEAFLLRNEVTAEEVERGLVDIQGIDWRNQRVTRDRFREARLLNFKTYRNILDPSACELEVTVSRLDSFLPSPEPFYPFRYSLMKDKPVFHHFQLRNLVACTTKQDVYFNALAGIQHYCPLDRTTRLAVDLQQHGLGPLKISTLAAKEDLLMFGGFGGEYGIQRLHSTDPLTCGVLTRDPNGITNHMTIESNRQGGSTAIISSNDVTVRRMDIETRQITSSIPCEWAVNCCAQSPDKHLLCAVGDSTDTVILNASSGEVIATLKGHFDYSFACAWSPCGRIIATGNQDMTTRLYDARKLTQPISILPCKLGAVRSLQFSDDGCFLGIAEPADFVHLVDLRKWESASTNEARLQRKQQKEAEIRDKFKAREPPLEQPTEGDAFSFEIPSSLSDTGNTTTTTNTQIIEDEFSRWVERGRFWDTLLSIHRATPMTDTSSSTSPSLVSALRLALASSPSSFALAINKQQQDVIGYPVQTIDFFGEIAGMSFSPGSDCLFIGNSDHNYGAMMEFERNTKHLNLLDAMFL